MVYLRDTNKNTKTMFSKIMRNLFKKCVSTAALIALMAGVLPMTILPVSAQSINVNISSITAYNSGTASSNEFKIDYTIYNPDLNNFLMKLYYVKNGVEGSELKSYYWSASGGPNTLYQSLSGYTFSGYSNVQFRLKVYDTAGSLLRVVQDSNTTSYCNTSCSSGGSSGGGGGTVYNVGSTGCSYMITIGGTSMYTATTAPNPPIQTINVDAGSPIVIGVPAPGVTTAQGFGAMSWATMNISGGLSGSFYSNQTYSNGTYSLSSITSDTNIGITFTGGTSGWTATCYTVPITLHAIQRNPQITSFSAKDDFLRFAPTFKGLDPSITSFPFISASNRVQLNVAYTNGGSSDTCQVQFTGAAPYNTSCASINIPGNFFTINNGTSTDGGIQTVQFTVNNGMGIATDGRTILYDPTPPRATYQVPSITESNGYLDTTIPINSIQVLCQDLNSSGNTTNTSGCQLATNRIQYVLDNSINRFTCDPTSANAGDRIYEPGTASSGSSYWKDTVLSGTTFMVPEAVNSDKSFCARVIDGAGNIGYTSPKTFRFDSSAPVIVNESILFNKPVTKKVGSTYYLDTTGNTFTTMDMHFVPGDVIPSIGPESPMSEGETYVRIYADSPATPMVIPTVDYNYFPTEFWTDPTYTLSTTISTLQNYYAFVGKSKFTVQMFAKDLSGKNATPITNYVILDNSAPIADASKLLNLGTTIPASSGELTVSTTPLSIADPESGIEKYEMTIYQNGSPFNLTSGGYSVTDVSGSPASSSITTSGSVITMTTLPSKLYMKTLPAKDSAGVAYSYSAKIKAINFINLSSVDVLSNTIKFDSEKPIITNATITSRDGTLTKVSSTSGQNYSSNRDNLSLSVDIEDAGVSSGLAPGSCTTKITFGTVTFTTADTSCPTVSKTKIIDLSIPSDGLKSFATTSLVQDYSVTINAKDVAGNDAIPFVTNIHIDQSAPTGNIVPQDTTTLSILPALGNLFYLDSSAAAQKPFILSISGVEGVANESGIDTNTSTVTFTKSGANVCTISLQAAGVTALPAVINYPLAGVSSCAYPISAGTTLNDIQLVLKDKVGNSNTYSIKILSDNTPPNMVGSMTLTPDYSTSIPTFKATLPIISDETPIDHLEFVLSKYVLGGVSTIVPTDKYSLLSLTGIMSYDSSKYILNPLSTLPSTINVLFPSKTDLHKDVSGKVYQYTLQVKAVSKTLAESTTISAGTPFESTPPSFSSINLTTGSSTHWYDATNNIHWFGSSVANTVLSFVPNDLDSGLDFTTCDLSVTANSNPMIGDILNSLCFAGMTKSFVIDSYLQNVTGIKNYIIKLQAKDLLGNAADYVVPMTINGDREIPTLTTTGISPTWTKTDQTIALTCNDGAGSGCKEILYCTMSSGVPCLPTLVYTIPLNISSHLHIRALSKDNVGNVSAVNDFEIKVDKTAPMLDTFVVKDGIGSSAVVLAKASDGKYYTNKTDVYISYNVSETDSGVIGNSCSVAGAKTITTVACTPGNIVDQKIDLNSGSEHSIILTANDIALNSGTFGLTIVQDAVIPTITVPVVITPIESGRKIDISLPIITDTVGMKELVVTLKNSTSSVAITSTFLPSVVTVPEDGLIILNADGSVSITPKTTSGFRSTLLLQNLPSKKSDGSQETYTVEVTGRDMAGNTITSTSGSVKYDTVAPQIASFVPVLISNIRGKGTATEPFLVGSTKLLPLNFMLKEETNGTVGARSLPLNIFLLNPQYDIDGVSNTSVCSLDSAFDSSRFCQSTNTINIHASNFAGNTDVILSDSVGNAVSTKMYITQDSTRPQLGAAFTIKAYPQTVAPTELAENAHFNKDQYTFKITDLTDVNSGGAFYVKATYKDKTDVNQTIERQLTQIGTTNDYTFSLDMTNLKSGAQNISLVFEDAFGNTYQDTRAGHTTETFVPFGIFFDQTAPDVSNFSYTWINNDVTYKFDAINDASYPVTIVSEFSTDGTLWTSLESPKVFNTQVEANAYQHVVTVPSPNGQIKLTIADKTFGMNATTLIDNDSTKTYRYMTKDINLTVTDSPSTEERIVGYVPVVSSIPNFKDFKVTVTDPYGKVDVLPTVSSFISTGAEITRLSKPVKGTYTFDTVLSYKDSSPDFISKKVAPLNVDYVKPRGTFTITPIVDEVFEDTTKTPHVWVVKNTNPTFDIGYAILKQYQTASKTIFDDGIPLNITVSGADTSYTKSIDPSSNAYGTLTLPMNQEKYYNLDIRLEDNATNFTTTSFKILKKASGPKLTTSLKTSTGSIMTLKSTATGESDVYLTNENTATLETVVTGEPEAPTFDVRIEGSTTPITGTTMATTMMVPTPYAMSYILPLTSDAVTTYVVKILDAAGNVTEKSIKIRRDQTGPQISGTYSILLPALVGSHIVPVLNDNTTPPSPLSFTDYSDIRYELVDATTGNLIGAYQPFTNTINIPGEGTTSFKIRFNDALGNETTLPDTYTTVVDTQDPVISLSWSPSTSPTTATGATLTISSLTDASKVTVKVLKNGVEMKKQELTAPVTNLNFGTFDLTRNNVLWIPDMFEVQVEDALGHALPAIIQLYNQDDLAPFVQSIVSTYSTSLSTLSWTMKAIDNHGVKINSISGKNLTTGEVFALGAPVLVPLDPSLPISMTGPIPVTYISTWTGVTMHEGHQYVMNVSMKDDLGNTGSLISSSIYTHPTTAAGANDPLWTPDSILGIDPTIILGNSLTVEISNGTTIKYVANNMPKGTNVIIGDVLAKGTNTAVIPAVQLTKLPIGVYTITIKDELGNIQTIPNYQVKPYLTANDLDINGDGYGGGLIDLKLLRQYESSGFYSTGDTDGTLTIRKNNMLAAFNLRMTSANILSFLQH